ncbi:MAG TPA: GNAT family N-acetyltransferase, partial [Anaerolineae bacterium]
VSSCVGFLDHKNRIAEVERVCTHGLYRRRGLAEAVIRACLERLKEAGYEFAYIQGYSPDANSLYSRLGPSRSKRWHIYELSDR